MNLNKRLDYYKGYTSNKNFFNPKFDRVFGQPQEVHLTQNTEVEGSYNWDWNHWKAPSDNAEHHSNGNQLIKPYNRRTPDLNEWSNIPQRSLYTGIDNPKLFSFGRTHYDSEYDNKKVKFAENSKMIRSLSHNRNIDFDEYKHRTSYK